MLPSLSLFCICTSGKMGGSASQIRNGAAPQAPPRVQSLQPPKVQSLRSWSFSQYLPRPSEAPRDCRFCSSGPNGWWRTSTRRRHTLGSVTALIKDGVTGLIRQRALLLLLALQIQPFAPAMAQQQLDRAATGSTETALQRSALPSDVWTRCCLTGDWNGLRPRLDDAGFKLEAVDISDIMSNPFGGTHQGTTAQTFIKLGLVLDLYRIIGWRGATFYVSGSEVTG